MSLSSTVASQTRSSDSESVLLIVTLATQVEPFVQASTLTGVCTEDPLSKSALLDYISNAIKLARWNMHACIDPDKSIDGAIVTYSVNNCHTSLISGAVHVMP